MENNKISFWQFLKQNIVEIPIIQRDYAQGRVGKEHLRKQFLTQLKSALDNPKEPTTLDFVYGNVESYQETEAFCPLDGQQRLTTLWLLHWYIAFRSGNLNTVKNTLEKFTYETRTSSREFCKALCGLSEDIDKESIVEHIQEQTWFFSRWKQDPTIQSMLRMLSGTTSEVDDGIERIFKTCDRHEFGEYWNQLISEECPITFYEKRINSQEMPISDDIYIKMNARGKQLTNFENFKADLIDWMEKDKSTSYSLKIAEKIDNHWTDIFWNNNKGKIDDIFFAFINRYLLNAYITIEKDTNTDIEKSLEFNHLYGDKGNDSKLEYQDFDIYKKILTKVMDKFEKTFDNIKKAKVYDFNYYFPCWANKNFSFIPIKEESITTLTQPQRVVFYAICKYFENDSFEENSFKQWMRVAWNIVENANIDNIQTMIGHIRLFEELSEGSHDIYTYLENLNINTLKSEASREQLEEEIAKVKQIRLDAAIWENAILRAEEYAFFKGAIRFLFTDANRQIDWKDFETKWKNAQSYFDEKGVSPKYRQDEKHNHAKLLRRLIVYFSDWSYFYKITYDLTPSTWKNILVNKELSTPVHYLLSNDDVLSYNYASFISRNQDPKQKYTKEYLICNPALGLMVSECKMHYRGDWCHGCYALYPSNVKADWKKYIIHPRIDILCDKHFKDDKQEECKASKLLWGIHINFAYDGHYFQWWGTPDDYQLDVYLMKNDNGKDYQQRHEPPLKNVSDEENYYCFRVDDNETVDSFINKLENLIQSSKN